MRVSRNELTTMFNEHLDGVNETIQIVDGCLINPSEVLKQLRPVHYHSAFENWLDSERQIGNIERDADDNYFIDEGDL